VTTEGALKMSKKVGILFGMERSFPLTLAQEITRRSGGDVVGEPVRVGHLQVDRRPPYDVVVDRISHEVPFYRTMLKQLVIQGAQVINNPFWWSADDKYFGCLVAMRADVAIPKTVLLPHKDHPEGTRDDSFSNLIFPLKWEEMFGYLGGFPIYLKPAYGGGWKDVSRCASVDEFLAAYHASRDLCMMAQEEIVFSEYYRCYVLGRERVHIMRYDPKAPHHERYVRNPTPTEPALKERIEWGCLALCRALGYDFNTVEFAVRDGIPYAIDFTNPCPDAEPASVGDENFAWVLENASEMLVDRARHPRPFEMTGAWPES
jgi:glutathione synthase/RimK-type ligase-like ATP-grasp enzyme